ncbi:MAG: SDR family NAD(P)-dependent oxidoreductase, partial [Sphingobacteriales bacterium]
MSSTRSPEAGRSSTTSRDRKSSRMAAADTAVVTGASSGIGEAIAASLLERGIPVVTLQRSAPKLKHKDLHFRAIDL